MTKDYKKERENEAQLRFLIEDIIDKLDLRDLPEEDLNNFRKKIRKEINRRIGSIILENLNNEGLKEYKDAIKEDSSLVSKKMESIARKYISDLDEKIRKDMSKFINTAFNNLS